MKTFNLSRHMGDEQDRDYAKALTDCDTVDDLKALVEAYAELAVDALPVVKRMTPDEFKEFRAGLNKERRGKFAGEAWATKYAAVVMPLPMMQITQIAAQYKAPFGVTWQRVRDLRPDLLQVPSERTRES